VVVLSVWAEIDEMEKLSAGINLLVQCGRVAALS
jgi:hypothetical protein